MQNKQPLFHKFLQSAVKFFCIKYTVEGTENLPDELSVIVSNHSKANGPILSQIYYPRTAYTWCNCQTMNLKEAPDYFYGDFTSNRPVYLFWLFRILSYILSPVLVYALRHAKTIAVYRDKRIFQTINESTEHLQNGSDIIIFPEHYDKHNNIIYDFQHGFTGTAYYYHKKTGKDL